MNRKLLVIAMVPLLVGFAGAMAFSEWSGSITKTINVTTATVTVTEKVECVGAYIAGTVKVSGSFTEYGLTGLPLGPSTNFGPFLLDGDGSHHVSSCPIIPKCSGGYPGVPDGIVAGDGNGCTDPDAFSLGEITFLGLGVGGASYTLNIYGLAPGDWIDLGMFESVHVSDDGPTVEIASTLTPSALTGTVGAGSYPLGFVGAPTTGYTPEDSGGWTWLADGITTPCESQYGLVSGSTLNPINVGPYTTPTSPPGKSIGLEYCDSGPLGPAAPAPLALSPGASVTVGPMPYAYILVGLDHSADDGTMGLTGAHLTYFVSATSP